jgi:hypothetical protein
VPGLTRVPHRASVILHPPHRHTRQVHLDQGFLHRTLPPPIALDDRAGLGLQLAIVTSRALVTPRRRPLVASRIAQPIRLRFQHRVQRLLDRAPDDVAEVLAHPLIIDPDHIAKPGPFAILFHGGSLSVWLRRSSRNANLTRAGATAQICERFFTSSCEVARQALARSPDYAA